MWFLIVVAQISLDIFLFGIHGCATGSCLRSCRYPQEPTIFDGDSICRPDETAHRAKPGSLCHTGSTTGESVGIGACISALKVHYRAPMHA
ncbi:uncharacterized protein BDV14DRAFT_18494 [Aspergillus stella-maris]|uniref:uncharacterized protein n=1 Tax=Aspergillus stella-maris TaxID=1810926 RepID=UPI003CCC8F43